MSESEKSPQQVQTAARDACIAMALSQGIEIVDAHGVLHEPWTPIAVAIYAAFFGLVAYTYFQRSNFGRWATIAWSILGVLLTVGTSGLGGATATSGEKSLLIPTVAINLFACFLLTRKPVSHYFMSDRSRS